MIATVRNMRAAEAAGMPGVFAHDPETGDEFSATSGDYFWLSEDEPLTGESGQPLLLCVRHSEIRQVVLSEAAR